MLHSDVEFRYYSQKPESDATARVRCYSQMLNLDALVRSQSQMLQSDVKFRCNSQKPESDAIA